MRLSHLYYLNRHDRRIMLVLLTVAAIAFALLFFVGRHVEPVDDVAADSLQARVAADSVSRSQPSRQPYYQQPEHVVERFAFDPNTADSTQLLRLGLQPWQVLNIYKFRAAGGIYRKKSDFARLYGLTVKQYRELEPYIQISADYLPASTLVHDDAPRHRDTLHHSEKMSGGFPEKMSEGETIDLNVADTALYRKVPGIGSYYARRIADYGQRLGGYVSVDQLDDIENFPPEAKAFFTVSTGSVRKIRINQLTLNELKRHPYINYYQARAITDYRRLHGPIRSLHDLHLLPEFSEESIARLHPYISYE